MHACSDNDSEIQFLSQRKLLSYGHLDSTFCFGKSLTIRISETVLIREVSLFQRCLASIVLMHVYVIDDVSIV